MAVKENYNAWPVVKPTAALVLADGTVITGRGIGHIGTASGEICFNTALTGYEEILTDPSYAGQIVTFTFPHIGNVGINDEDVETLESAKSSGVRGVVLRTNITNPSNFRATGHLDDWLKSRKIVGIAGVDTRALTALIRENGMPDAIICNNPDGELDIDGLKAEAAGIPSLVGQDLAKDVTSTKSLQWHQSGWSLENGYVNRENGKFNVVAIDYGIKCNILRMLSDADCNVNVVPANATGSDILKLKPDGVFLSNGPGDPAATGKYAIETIQEILQADIPLFGICLGHQLLALALGCKTTKMHQGHHGANHPVRDNSTGRVEITSMNHGFAVDRESLPNSIFETHVSLFDGSNCGIRIDGKPVFSVQYHPEASPGPRDSHYLFRRFTNMIRKRQGLPLIDEVDSLDIAS